MEEAARTRVMLPRSSASLGGAPRPLEFYFCPQLMEVGAVDAPFPEGVRRAWPGLVWAEAEPLEGGLINRTWMVPATGAEGSVVVQRVSDIFDPRIHENIEAVTQALSEAGVCTPTLVRTGGGALWVELPEGTFRVLTRLAGRCAPALSGEVAARSVGTLLARFHGALEGLSNEFVGMRGGVHDTPRHLEALARAVEGGGAHRLYDDVARLNDATLACVAALPEVSLHETIIGHGDPKAGNVIFNEGLTDAVALIDLDTVGPIALAHELGDALRSWCNPAGEDHPAPKVDEGAHAAAVQGYFEGWRGRLTPGRRAEMAEALRVGLPWICLELSARFAADALEERYFGWDASAFPSRGAHNLWRARGQLALAQSALRCEGLRRAHIARAASSAQ